VLGPNMTTSLALVPFNGADIRTVEHEGTRVAYFIPEPKVVVEVPHPDGESVITPASLEYSDGSEG
jgi:hypothetical protein